jgi:hypothetical protein
MRSVLWGRLKVLVALMCLYMTVSAAWNASHPDPAPPSSSPAGASQQLASTVLSINYTTVGNPPAVSSVNFATRGNTSNAYGYVSFNGDVSQGAACTGVYSAGSTVYSSCALPGGHTEPLSELANVDVTVASK